MKVLLRGPLLTNSGYGVHSRQIFEALENCPQITELVCQCTNWGRCSWIVDRSSHGGLIGRIMQKSTQIENKSFDLSVQVQLPDEWDTKIASKNIGVTAAVEATKCSQAWIDQCNKVD